MTRRKPTARTCGVLAFEMGEGGHKGRRRETRLRRGDCCAKRRTKESAMMVLRPAVILNVGTLAVLLWGVPVYSLSPTLVGIYPVALSRRK